MIKLALPAFAFFALSSTTLAQSQQILDRLDRRLDTIDRLGRVHSVPTTDKDKNAKAHFSSVSIEFVTVTKIVPGDLVTKPSEAFHPTLAHPVQLSDRFTITTSEGTYEFPGAFSDATRSVGSKYTSVTFYYPFVVLNGEVDSIPQSDPTAATVYRVYYDFYGNAVLNYRLNNQSSVISKMRAPRASVAEIDYFKSLGISIVYLEPWGGFKKQFKSSIRPSTSWGGAYSYGASLTYLGTPYGEDGSSTRFKKSDRFATDGVNSYTFKASQSVSQADRIISSPSTGGSLTWQLCSDNFPLQLTASASDTWAWGGGGDATGSVEVDRASLGPLVDGSFSASYESIAGGDRGYYVGVGLTSYILNSPASAASDKSGVTLFGDYQFASKVEGLAIWDAGLTWKIDRALSLTTQYTQGGSVALIFSYKR